MPPELTPPNFWKIAPGEQAHLWPLCLARQCITIGWPAAGDVTTKASNEFEETFQTAHRINPACTRDGVKQLWKFARDIKIGDQIVANLGKSKVLGLGVVTGQCEYHPENPHYKHQLPVDWYDTKPRHVNQGGWVPTLISLNATTFEAIKNASQIDEVACWKFAPPVHCWDFKFCLEQECLALGYDGLGNIWGFHRLEYEKARDALLRQEPHFKSAEIYGVWEMTQLLPGAKVIAVDRETRKVLGYGEVTGTYFFDESAAQFKHRVPVRWLTIAGRSDEVRRLKTMSPITATEFETLTGVTLNTVRSSQPINVIPSSPTIVASSSLPPFPLNQILYGPPGTGKTFNSIARAVEIIDGSAPLDRIACKARFEELRETKQIEFVTFHQSFSYEEFIEGLRPVLDDEGDGQVRYEIRNGVLKELARRAIEQACETPSQRGFDEAWEELRRRVESGELTHIEGRTAASRHELSFQGEKLNGANVLSDKPNSYFYTTRTTQEKAWKILPAGTQINGADFSKLQLDSQGQGAFNAVIHNKLLEFGQENKPNFAVAPRFVLIIDEINRGNISKILGELITLLEEDKRIGRTNELQVTLPVSQERFALPPNLYVLGTMNTADKSLALLDIALRRRFSFEEMPPRSGLFPEFARDVLQTMNLRLESVLDREHRLGHAYFIGCHDEAAFNRVFRDKIIPLLQEFFYNDWETLRDVLGESGNGAFIKPLPTLKGIKTRTQWRWWFDNEVAGDTSKFNSLATLKANYAALESSSTGAG